MAKIKFFNRLSYKQARNTILVAFLIGIFLTGLQISYDLIAETSRMDETIAQILSMLKDSATDAVYNIDEELGGSVVAGLFKYQSIRSVKITDDIGETIAEDSRPGLEGGLDKLVELSFGRDKKYKIDLIDRRGDNIGTLTVVVDTYAVATQFFKRARIVIISDVVRNIVLSVILTISFYYSLIRPLIKIIRGVSDVNPDQPNENPIAFPKGHRKNEVGLLVGTTNNLLYRFDESLERQRAAEAEIKKHRDHLEVLVAERTEALRNTLEEVKEKNEHIMESIQYAKMIQHSLLPNKELIDQNLPESFIIWMPRDIVGGDIYDIEFLANAYIVALIDCTGHGVPGAFMTMIASSALRRIIKEDNLTDPGEILKNLNRIVKTTLQQDKAHSTSDDGMDAAVCVVNLEERKLVFAGAKIHLIHVFNHGIKVHRGDKTSLGYRKSDIDFTFSNKTVELSDNMSFYLTSDGYTDQLGGKPRRRFSYKRLKNLLLDIHQENFKTQEKILIEEFQQHKGESPRQDDVTILGFNVRSNS